MNLFERLTGELMLNEQAQAIAAQIPADVNLAALADQYARAVTHDCATSQAFCLAAEHHMRLTAMSHFHEPGVNEALCRLEAAKKSVEDARRKARNNQRAAERRRRKKPQKQQTAKGR